MKRSFEKIREEKAKKAANNSTNTEADDDITEEEEPDEFHILVSSRKLRIVSPYFDNIFKRDYSETVSDTDGKFHVAADGWTPEVLALAMNMVHLQFKEMP